MSKWDCHARLVIGKLRVVRNTTQSSVAIKPVRRRSAFQGSQKLSCITFGEWLGSADFVQVVDG